MLTDGDGLTARQRDAIPILLRSRTLEAAAAEAGVSVRQLRRWNSQPTFRTQVTQARTAMISDLLTNLTQAGAEAIEVLRQVAATGPAPARVTAASRILDMIVKHQEIDVLEHRVEELERLAEKQQRRARKQPWQ